MEELILDIEIMEKDKNYSKEYEEKIDSLIKILEEEKQKSKKLNVSYINSESIYDSLINSYKDKKNLLKNLVIQKNFHSKIEKLGYEIKLNGMKKEKKPSTIGFEFVESIPINPDIINEIINDINDILKGNSKGLFGNLNELENYDHTIKKYINDLITIKENLVNLTKRTYLFENNIGDLESQNKSIKKEFEEVHLKYLKSKEILIQAEIKNKKKKRSLI